MILAVTIFAAQDGFSRHLAETYNVLMVVMIRYWGFAAFVLIQALRQPRGLRSVTTGISGCDILPKCPGCGPTKQGFEQVG